MDTIAYVDQARLGEENMAIDRRMLEDAERTGSTYLRVYRWSEPTLSLGHFQADENRDQHPPSRQLTTVLRASGGGAIVHHLEWTYAVACPVGRNRVGAATELYDLIHDALVAGLRDLGWDASKWAKPSCPTTMAEGVESVASVGALAGCASTATAAKAKEPFLCFLRRSCGDIVVDGYKVVGSAQRRLGGSVMQHGSILLLTSPFAPELPGLLNLDREIGAKVPKSEVDMELFGQTVLSWIGGALKGR